MTKFIVTIAPPTPNGNLHLGHIAGPFLSADIFTRVQRVKNNEVLFVSYTDDYQDYVARKAVELGKEKFELARQYGQNMHNTLIGINIDLDYFLHAYQNKDYEEAIANFYMGAVKLNAIKEEIMEVPYSYTDKQYGYEAFARGICNFCGAESDASQCESCANSPDLTKMGTLRSVLTNEPVGFVKKNREYLDLKKYKSFLMELYSDNPIREELRNFIHQVLNSDNLKWFIDRPGGHGINLTINNHEKIIHTWFSGLAGYFASSKQHWQRQNTPEKHEYFWKDRDTQVVNFLGFDCSFSHAIVYPSLIHGLEGFTQKFTQLTNRFLKLEGGDFSTSRNHAIWVDDILKDYTSDGVRFYLALISPETKEKNFEMTKFEHWYHEFFNTKISCIKHLMDNVSVQCLDFLNKINLNERLLKIYESWKSFSSLEKFSITGMAISMQDLLKYIDELVTEDYTERAIEASLVYLILSEPIHPQLSQELINLYKIDRQIVLNSLEI